MRLRDERRKRNATDTMIVSQRCDVGWLTLNVRKAVLIMNILAGKSEAALSEGEVVLIKCTRLQKYTS
jgi:hypothetical protein